MAAGIEGLASGPVSALWRDELDSTNAEARRLAEAGESGPLWIAARRQTSGRGRRGRSWDTAQGNLAATLLCATAAAPLEAAQLSFVLALAVRDFAAAWVPQSLLKVKWPNDVLLAGGKLSGILLESGRRPDGRLWIAAGVGVNLASAPAGTEFPAASLADHLKADVASPPAPEAALQQLSAAFARRAADWGREGFAPVRAAWTEAAAGLDARCTVRLSQASLAGVAEGLDADGALQLRLDNGELRRITAGDVFFGGA